MIPRRAAIVRSMPASGSFPDNATSVTLARLPWEPEVTEPDPREETRPRVGSIRNPDLDETRGPYAPARRVRRDT